MAPQRQQLILRALALAGLVLVAWVATVVAGGSRTAAPHLFYLPVVLAALWYRPPVAVLVAALAGVVAGPLTPLDTGTGESQSLENWLIRAGAFLAVSLVASAVASRQRDAVEDRAQVADERRELDLQRSALLQIIAHEIRTPVTVLKGGSELIASGRSGDRTADLAAAMRNAVRRLEDLAVVVTAAEDTDAMGRLPTLSVDVGTFVGCLVGEVSGPRQGARVKVACDVEGELALPGPDQISLAAKLVLENALRFSEEPVDVTVANGDHVLWITVADRGPGIPETVWSAVSPFRQGDPSTTRRHGGLGMGLYTARKLIAATGGRMELETEPDRGSRVTLAIPARPARETDVRWCPDGGR